jgi:glycosyltransferase involved in cell wall biosynthesis
MTRDERTASVQAGAGRGLLLVSFSVCPAPDRHGVSLLNVLKALSRFAARPDFPVDVLTLRVGELPFIERFMRTRMLRVPLGGATLREQVDSFRRAIRRQLEGQEYAVIHLRSAWGGRAVLDAVAEHDPATRPRVVYEVARSTEGEPRAADRALAAQLADEERHCLERADLVLVPSVTARRYLEALKLDRGRVHVVSPGVDIDHFDWEPSPPSPSGAPPRVVYAGRIGPGRGIRLLVRAAGLLRARRPLTLVLAGPIDDGFDRLLDDAIAQAKLTEGSVERLGPIAHGDVPRLLAGAAACVAPASPDETDRPLAGFPTKLLEYMACRRAVVAPRRAAVEEIVRDGVDGLLFDPGDPDDLAAKLGRLLDDERLRDRLAEAGYERVRARHPASATRRLLLEAYGQLLPELTWSPPEPASAAPVDGLPPHQDTTTARRLASNVVLDAAAVGVGLSVAAATASDANAGRAQGDRSGEIVIPDIRRPEIPVVRGEIVIEAVLPSLAPEDKSGSFFDETRTSVFRPLLDPAAAGFDEVSDDRTDFEIVIEPGTDTPDGPDGPDGEDDSETTAEHKPVKH